MKEKCRLKHSRDFSYLKNRPINKIGRFVKTDPLTRFERSYKTDEAGCWVWQKALFNQGYARFRGDDGEVSGHRWSYKYFNGPLKNDSKYNIDHLCKNRKCVNPDHLEQVTQKENIRRGNTGKALKDRTHCKSGHLFSGANLVLYRNYRVCRRCIRVRYLRRRRRLKNES